MDAFVDLLTNIRALRGVPNPQERLADAWRIIKDLQLPPTNVLPELSEMLAYGGLLGPPEPPEDERPSVDLGSLGQMRVVVRVVWGSSTAIGDNVADFGAAAIVLFGSALFSRYNFLPFDEDAEGRIGKLKQRSGELLCAGDIIAVDQGGGTIHSIVPQELPLVLIVLTDSTLNASSQESWRYFPPSIAIREDILSAASIDPAFEAAVVQTSAGERLLLESTVEFLGPALSYGRSAALLLLLESALWESGRYNVAPGQLTPADLPRLIDLLVPRHVAHRKRTFRALTDALALERKRLLLRRALTTVGDPGLRLFLALLLTQRSRTWLLDVLSNYLHSNGQEEQAIGEWLKILEGNQFLKKSGQGWSLAAWSQQDDEKAIDWIVSRATMVRLEDVPLDLP